MCFRDAFMEARDQGYELTQPMPASFLHDPKINGQTDPKRASVGLGAVIAAGALMR